MTQNFYDGLGRVVAVNTYNGPGGTLGSRTVNLYDGLDRVIGTGVLDLDGTAKSETRYGFDLAGRQREELRLARPGQGPTPGADRYFRTDYDDKPSSPSGGAQCTLAEAAALLSITEWSVVAMATTGDLPVVGIGSKRFRLHDVEAARQRIAGSSTNLEPHP